MKKESEDSVETPGLLALRVLLVSEDLLETEDSPVPMDYQVQKVLKEIGEFRVHQAQKVLLEIQVAQESLVCQVQGVSQAHQESKGQKASQDHLVHQVKMVVRAPQDPSEIGGQQELWEFQAPKALMAILGKQGNRDLLESQVKGVLQEKMEKLVQQDLQVQLALQETEENRDLQV